MEIKYYDDKYFDSLNELLQETFSVSKTYKNETDGIELIVCNGLEVIGYLNLTKCRDMITGDKYFYVNYVCVKKNFRGLGVATTLFEKVFEICKELDVSYLELTSNPSRIAAHSLYEKLGFSIRNTTVFRKEFL